MFLHFLFNEIRFVVSIPSLFNDVVYPIEGLDDPSSAYPYGSLVPSARVFHAVAIGSSLIAVHGGNDATGVLLDVNKVPLYMYHKK